MMERKISGHILTGKKKIPEVKYFRDINTFQKISSEKIISWRTEVRDELLWDRISSTCRAENPWYTGLLEDCRIGLTHNLTHVFGGCNEWSWTESTINHRQ